MKNEVVIAFEGALELSGIVGFIPGISPSAPAPPQIGLVVVGTLFGLFIDGVVVAVFVPPAVLDIVRKSSNYQFVSIKTVLTVIY